MCSYREKVQFPPVAEPPDILRNLPNENDDHGSNFVNITWKYDSCFPMKSFCVNEGKERIIHKSRSNNINTLSVIDVQNIYDKK